jgi:hypothetical protein
MLAVNYLRGLGDFIDENDPCTKDPSDPICQATAAQTATDPCVLNPNQSFCQAAIVAAAGNTPTPGSDDTSWLSFLDTPSTSAPKPPTAATPTITASVPGASSAAASLAALKPSMGMLIGLGILGVVGAIVYRKRQAARAA